MYEYLTEKEYKNLSREDLVKKLRIAEKTIQQKSYEETDSLLEYITMSQESQAQLEEECNAHLLCQTELDELKLKFEMLRPDNQEVNRIMKYHHTFVDIFNTLEVNYKSCQDLMLELAIKQTDSEKTIKRLKKYFDKPMNVKAIFKQINQELKEQGE